MANYWYWSWNRHLKAAVLPALGKIYRMYAQQIVPVLESRRRPSEEATAGPVTFTRALAVYTRATCEALYLEATRFLVLLYRREIAFVGQEARVFPEKGINLRQVAGFQAYERLRSAARNRGYIPQPCLEALRDRQRGCMYPIALGRGIARGTPADVKHLYEDLCGFLQHVVEALHQ